jgi:hypothetical protein
VPLHLLLIAPEPSEHIQVPFPQSLASMVVGGSMQVEAPTEVKFRVLPFRVKIEGLSLIGCVSQ